MANVNAAFGFRPTMRTRSGAAGSMLPCNKLVGYGTALFPGDAVCQAAANIDTGFGATPSTLTISAAITPGTTPVLGVNLIYGLASTATQHIIVRADGGIFVVEGDGTGATFLVAASMSKNANIALTAGLTAPVISQHQLSETSIQTTNTLDLKIRGLYPNPNNALGKYAQVYVSFNNLTEANQTVGV